MLAPEKSLHAVRERPLELQLAFQLLGQLRTDHPMQIGIVKVMKKRGVGWMQLIVVHPC